jgi:hypothetical protein
METISLAEMWCSIYDNRPWTISNKTANGSLRDAVLTLSKGILSCQNSTQLHSLRLQVTSRTAITKRTALRYAYFHETHKRPTALCAELLYGISPRSVNKREEYGQKVIHILN